MKRSILFTSAVALAANAAIAADPTWSAKYDFTSITTPSTRSMRSIALSSDGTSFFTGFIQGSTSRELRKHDVSTGNVTATLGLGSFQPNSLATDDRGNLFIGGGGSFGIYNGNTLAASGTALLPGTAAEGIDVYKSGSTYYAYVARSDGIVQRYDVTNPALPALDVAFGTLGSFVVPGAGQLRGLDVDSAGNVYVAQRDTAGTDRAGKLFRLSAGNTPVTSVANVTGAMDVIEYNGALYVTQYNGNLSAISVLDAASLASVDLYDTNFLARGTAEGYAMLDVTAGGNLLMVDQIYGGSGSGAGTLDRVLISSAVPEPTSLAILGLGASALLARRRRRSF